MTALHVTISSTDGKHFRMTSDNLRREDATEPEIAMANVIENALAMIQKSMAETIYSYEKNQSGPLAESEHIKKGEEAKA